MKKLVLAALLGFGVFVAGCATTDTTANAKAGKLSDEQYANLFADCSFNENKVSCYKVIFSGRLDSVEKCGITCYSAGDIYMMVENYQQAFKYYKKSCDINDKIGCFKLAILYSEGKGVRQDFTSARKSFEKACDANLATACNNLGVLYANGKGVNQNLSTAKKYFGKACDLGAQFGCDSYKELNEMGVK